MRRTQFLTALLVALLVLLVCGGDKLTVPGPPHLAAQPIRIFPTPQSVEKASTSVPLNGPAVLIAGSATDPSAVEIVKQVVAAAGGTTVPPGASDNEASMTHIYVGTGADNPSIEGALAGMAVDGSEALGKEEGYVLASGVIGSHKALILAGHDSSGVFYAAQTLRQVIQIADVASVVVKDWPLMRIRGVVEGFYGFPWTHQARLDQLRFYGQQKLNTYMYSPKDDPLLRQLWRQQYSGLQLAELSELINTAASNHVRFSYALSPGTDICYSKESDLEAAVAKVQALYELGVKTFSIALDDIEMRLQCGEDRAMFGRNNDRGLAAAQSYFVNQINQEFVRQHPDVSPLEIVPTKYSGSDTDPYKQELGATLDTDILVQWTGTDVIPPTITSASVRAARRAYGTRSKPRSIFIWDNYPVNDFAPDRLFLGPVVGRDRDLYTVTPGITSNPMVQPYVSMPALASYADFTWNAPRYDGEASVAAALKTIAGPDLEVQNALNVFADLNKHWQSDELTRKSPLLAADIDAFWRSYEGGAFEDTPLKQRAALISRLPEVLAEVSVKGFYSDAKNWIVAAGSYGDAVQSAIDMLSSVAAGDASAAAEARATMERAEAQATRATQPLLNQAQLTPSVGDGLFAPFLDRAAAEMDRRFPSTGSGS